MIKRLRWLLLALCLFGVSASHAAPVLTMVDDRGVTVRFDVPPARIVTLLPSLTETVCELGACAKLVGTDRYSNHPASVRTLPKTGGLDDANIELIASLKPDVVLLALSSRVTDRLESLGIKVVALEPRTYQDVQRVAGKVSQIVLGNTEGGARLWRRLEAQVNGAASTVPAPARGLTVYYEVDSAPYAAGESSFIGETLTRLGAKNIVPTSLGPFPKLNPEYIVRANPQVIMVSMKHATSLAARPGWDRIRAVQGKRVCAFTADQGDVLSRPGPRMGEAAQIMARCLRDAVLPGGVPNSAGGVP